VISLTHKVSGHKLKTDDASVDFWKSAGYAVDEPPAKKAPAKKVASSKSDTK
jgi:hypothetical protein